MNIRIRALIGVLALTSSMLAVGASPASAVAYTFPTITAGADATLTSGLTAAAGFFTDSSAGLDPGMNRFNYDWADGALVTKTSQNMASPAPTTVQHLTSSGPDTAFGNAGVYTLPNTVSSVGWYGSANSPQFAAIGVTAFLTSSVNADSAPNTLSFDASGFCNTQIANSSVYMWTLFGAPTSQPVGMLGCKPSGAANNDYHAFVVTIDPSTAAITLLADLQPSWVTLQGVQVSYSVNLGATGSSPALVLLASAYGTTGPGTVATREIVIVKADSTATSRVSVTGNGLPSTMSVGINSIQLWPQFSDATAIRGTFSSGSGNATYLSVNATSGAATTSALTFDSNVSFQNLGTDVSVLRLVGSGNAANPVAIRYSLVGGSFVVARSTLTSSNITTGSVSSMSVNPVTAGASYTASGSSALAYVAMSATTYSVLSIAAPQQAQSYTVTFDANGGSGSMNAQSASSSTALTTNAFSRNSYTFAGWNTAANGSGTAYADGASYAFGASVTLYAQWTAVQNNVVAPPPDPMMPTGAPTIVKSGTTITCSLGEFSQQASFAAYTLLVDGEAVVTSMTSTSFPMWLIPNLAAVVNTNAAVDKATFAWNSAWAGKKLQVVVLAYANHATGLIYTDEI